MIRRRSRRNWVWSPAWIGRVAMSRALLRSHRLGGEATGTAARDFCQIFRAWRSLSIRQSGHADQSAARHRERRPSARPRRPGRRTASTRGIRSARSPLCRELERPDALITVRTRSMFNYRERSQASRSTTTGCPCMSDLARIHVEAGGLMSYGPTLSTCSGAPPPMSTEFSRAPSPPTCRSSSRPSSSW